MASVILAILGISLLMIVHEAGHLFGARASGMRVKTFSIGFGPALFKIRPKGSETTYKLCVVPLLAYVEIDGANPLEELDPNDKGLYGTKSVAARALAMAGGPLANYLFAALLVFGLALSGWRTEVPTSVVGRVDAGSPAEAAGVRAGDVILAIEGRPVHDFKDVARVTSARPGKPTTFLFQREGVDLPPATLVPRDATGRGVIGVTSKFDTRIEHDSVGQAATRAVTEVGSQTADGLRGIAYLVSHGTTQGMTGPVGMAKQLAGQADRGAYAFLVLLVSMSIGLGLFNLLPLPFLDGGRLTFLAVEALKGRRITPTFEAIVHATGMVLLLGAAALITWRDITGS
jgi:regulator of sigma E protease